MALIKCTECGKEISDSAENCPHCGCKTSQGVKISQTKKMGLQYVGELISMVIGLILFVSALPELTDHSSYYWEYGFWREDSDTTMALLKLILGIILFIGSIIGIFCIGTKPKELLSSSVQIDSIKSADDQEVVEIPKEKRRYGVCEKCRQTGMVAVSIIPVTGYEHKLCSKCIQRYSAKIK